MPVVAEIGISVDVTPSESLILAKGWPACSALPIQSLTMTDWEDRFTGNLCELIREMVDS